MTIIHTQQIRENREREKERERQIDREVDIRAETQRDGADIWTDRQTNEVYFVYVAI